MTGTSGLGGLIWWAAKLEERVEGKITLLQATMEEKFRSRDALATERYDAINRNIAAMTETLKRVDEKLDRAIEREK